MPKIQILRPKFTLVLACVLWALGGCASKTASRVSSAATTPLSDLNIVQSDIPDVLQDAKNSPYLAPKDQSCAVITAEIQALDEALGPDLDSPDHENSPTMIERGSELAQNTAIGALQRTAEGIIPFRSWVRKLSGAERHSKHVAAAITAGSARRAFLKGMGTTHSCTWHTPKQVAATSTQAP